MNGFFQFNSQTVKSNEKVTIWFRMKCLTKSDWTKIKVIWSFSFPLKWIAVINFIYLKKTIFFFENNIVLKCKLSFRDKIWKTVIVKHFPVFLFYTLVLLPTFQSPFLESWRNIFFFLWSITAWENNNKSNELGNFKQVCVT